VRFFGGSNIIGSENLSRDSNAVSGTPRRRLSPDRLKEVAAKIQLKSSNSRRTLFISKRSSISVIGGGYRQWERKKISPAKKG